MSTETLSDPGTWNGARLDHSCFINGRWTDGEDSPYAVQNPTTEEQLALVGRASETQVAEAIAAARDAFDSGPWSRVTPAERSTLLHRLCDLFESRMAEFVEDEVSELGSPLWLTDEFHVRTATTTLRFYADLAKTGPTGGYERGLPILDEPFPSASLLRQEPAGVVAGITAYNFPLTLLVRKLGGALASGCTCIILPSERAPLSTWRFFKLVEEIGYPAGVANLVMGGREAGVTLTTSPLVDLVSFTGSVAVGQQVMLQASSTTKKVVLELGGKSPTIVLPGADLSQAVGPSIDRFVIATGQGCGVTSRTLVARNDYDAYLDAATEYIGNINVGDPRRADVQVGPLIREEQRASVEGYVERALEAGAQILAGGGRPDEPAGYFMNPTYLGGLDNDSEIAQNELFGPVGLLMPYSTVDEAIEVANKSRYGLYASVWGPTGEAMRVARRLSTGTVGINGGGAFRPDAPWGGFRDTGVGREAGEDGFREFFEVKHIEWPL